MVGCETPSIFSFVFCVDAGEVQFVADLSENIATSELRNPIAISRTLSCFYLRQARCTIAIWSEPQNGDTETRPFYRYLSLVRIPIEVDERMLSSV
jgi:hypothetical protein